MAAKRPGEGKLPLPKKLRAHCRALRADATDAEALLWRLLRNRGVAGVKFRRQHPIPPYIVDFYCEKMKLAIELDGGQHADVRQAEYDRQRTDHLERRGVRVIRFWNNDVLREAEKVLEAIYEALTPAPSPGGRGDEQ